MSGLAAPRLSSRQVRCIFSQGRRLMEARAWDVKGCLMVNRGEFETASTKRQTTGRMRRAAGHTSCAQQSLGVDDLGVSSDNRTADDADGGKDGGRGKVVANLRGARWRHTKRHAQDL